MPTGRHAGQDPRTGDGNSFIAIVIGGFLDETALFGPEFHGVAFSFNFGTQYTPPCRLGTAAHYDGALKKYSPRYATIDTPGTGSFDKGAGFARVARMKPIAPVRLELEPVGVVRMVVQGFEPVGS
jgi:hypothetical protein